MIKKEPRMNITDIIAFTLIYLGLLIIIVALFLFTINSIGATAEVLNAVFITVLMIYLAALIYGIAYAMIHLFKWLVWETSTPKWQKQKIKEQRNK